jgi:uncharacterized membrane protein
MGFLAALIGAFLGYWFAGLSAAGLGMILGAIAGWTVTALVSAQRRLTELEDQTRALSERLAAREERPVPLAPVAEPARAARAAPVPPPAAVRPSPTLPLEFDVPAPSSEVRPAPPPPPFAEPPLRPSAERYESYEPAIVRVVREYFTGGNTLVRVGVILLFIGVAFLVGYVAQRFTVPIEYRLTAVALGAIVLLVLGWRLREKRAGYALALQGGAVAILYLTVFAALRLYSLISPAATFGMLVAIAALSAALAVLQNSMWVALLGVAGGFLAPILASTGEGNHVFLFSYYAILNAGILAIAWFRAWRALNVVGFLFTFVIGTAWGVLRYRSDLFASTEPFLILFFLFYVAIAILYAIRQAPDLKGYVDGTLIFGTPIFAFGLQTGMLHDRRYALAVSSLAVSALYIGLGWLINKRRHESLRLLVEAFLALGVAFLTLAFPLALDGHWSAASWGLEGAALVWIGCRQNRKLPRLAGAALQVGAGFLFWLRAHHYDENALPILNSGCIGGLMIGVASAFSSVMFRRYRERLAPYEGWLSTFLFLLGLLWWLIAGLSEIERFASALYETPIFLVFMAATALLTSEVHRRLDLPVARWPALCLLPVMILTLFWVTTEVDHPFENRGYIAWPLAFAGLYVILRRHEGAGGMPLANVLHIGSLWLLTGLLCWEVAWDIDWAVRGSGSWPAIAWVLVPALMLFLLPKLGESVAWPFRAHRATYVANGGAGIAVFVVGWSVVTNAVLPGDPAPLPYVPLLNPLDIAQGFAVLALAHYVMHVRRAGFALYADFTERGWLYALAALVFIWANAILLRTIHHWTGVPFDLIELLRSTVVQTSLSIFWTVLALAAMLFATKKGRRALWVTGGVLLVAVVIKLFLVDLSRVGTVGRIVSFVGVGVLMLIMGYFSPLPPAEREEK